jgi:hypothetical protein
MDHESDMEPVTQYRLDLADKRFEAVADRMQRIADSLTEIKIALSRLPTINGLWGMIATVIGMALTIPALIVGILTYLPGFRH